MQQPCANIEASAAELYDYIRLNTYFALSAATIRGYYHVLTLEEEVDHYKATRITGSLVLYCANRYLPLPFFIYNLASLPFSLDRPRPISCNAEKAVGFFLEYIQYVPWTETISLLCPSRIRAAKEPVLGYRCVHALLLTYAGLRGAHNIPYSFEITDHPSYYSRLCCTGRPLQVQHIV
ncbi:hypothetical protein ONZ51_g3676 [Trametes cubensis]|uniref:DUF6533 domain-containing protein n=1 Tax=Trametes cubensis TaxID=1111947 RepID=A0AAD7XCT3_9APHY|nr:hypothetical protein ONZ51_g3676 [Trametes cubensis]